MKRFLFNVKNCDDEDISISIECIDGHVQIISEVDNKNVFIPLITSEQSRIIAMALIEIAAEADGQIAAEICDL
jgi:hypothetical protein